MYYYYYYSQKYPDDVIIYVEEVNKEENYIIVDFIDSGQHRKFSSLIGDDSEIGKTSMTIIKNYYPRKKIQENTAYVIKKSKLKILQNLISVYEQESNLLQYEINLDDFKEELFDKSISIGDVEKLLSPFSIIENSFINQLNLCFKGKVKFNVRNVGLANWNEIIINNKVVVVYDIGAPTFATPNKVREIIGNKIIEYFISKPILVLSHWDKDHYHSLIEMNDEEIKCFSKFICIDRAVTNTTSILLNRIQTILGSENVFQIPNIQKIPKVGTPLYLISKKDSQFLIFTSMYHKTKNISGLVVALRTKKSSVIFSGDCLYSQLSNHVLPELNYRHNHHLIVPHHGGQAGKYIYESKTIIKNNAVISAGQSKHHPSKYNTAFLREEFTDLRSTKVENKDIIIEV